MKIKIEDYRRIDSGSLEGKAKVLFEDIGLTVNEVKVVISKKGGHFYAFGSDKYIEKETGETKYKEHCAFYIKGGYQEFYEAMNVAFKEYFKNEQQKAKAPPPPPPQSYYSNEKPLDDLPF